MRYRFISSLCVLSVCFCAQVTSDEFDVRIVTEEWAPYNYAQGDTVTGFSVDIANEIMAMLNEKYPIELLPGIRGKYILSNEKNALMLTVFRTPDRESQYKWIGPIGTGSIYFYKKTGNPLTIRSLDDAKRVKVIACRYAGLIPDLLRSMGFRNLETTATESAQIYNKILVERCDLGISDTDLGVKYCLSKIGAPPNSLTRIDVEVFAADLYIACNKDFPDEIIDAWQQALDRLKKSERYNEIYDSYY